MKGARQVTIKLNILPIENSPGYIIHYLDLRLKFGLHKAFQAQGINIAADLVGSSPEVDPEWIISQNPDVIIKYPMGADYQGGFGQTETAPFQEWLDEMVNRAGFSEINAVKNGEVYIVSQIIKTGAFENVAICYVAKLLYPDLFEDMDPVSYLRQMVEEYMGLDWEDMDGVFIYPSPF